MLHQTPRNLGTSEVTFALECGPMAIAGLEPNARVLSFNGKDYRVDRDNLLIDPQDWDEDFARQMAPATGILGTLTDRHWEVLLFIRRFWEERGVCPTAYQTCRCLGLHLAAFPFLFPAGHQRGACFLAGISFRAAAPRNEEQTTFPAVEGYRIDRWGYLQDPSDWDEGFAVRKALEMKVPGGLAPAHWRVLHFLREEFSRTLRVPTFFEACEATGIGLEEFEGLFPDGYHRGAVKLAGLRIHADPPPRPPTAPA